MNLTKLTRCHIRMNSRWVSLSAVCMGISVFLRTVYFFGLTNLRDLDFFQLVMQVVFPMMIAAGYLVMIKGFQLNSPILFGGLIGAYAANYLMLMRYDAMGLVGGVLLVLVAGVFIVTGLGYLPNRIYVITAAGALALYRFIMVDLNVYILPISQFRPVAYLPEASNLFGILAVALMAPALVLTRLSAPADKDAEEPDTTSGALN